MNKYYIALGILSAAILLAIIGGFSVVGSPFTKKAQALDKQRLADFSQIKYAINTYYSKYQRLPSSLSEVKSDSTYKYINILDPQTQKTYEYIAKSNISYELCTEFSTKTNSNSSNNYTSGSSTAMVLPSFTDDSFTTHDKGYYCFTYQSTSTYNYYPTPSLPPPTACSAYEKLGTVKINTDDSITIEYDIKDIGQSITIPKKTDMDIIIGDSFSIGDKVTVKSEKCKFTIIKLGTNASNSLSTLTPSPTANPACPNFTVKGKVISDQGTYFSITFDNYTSSGNMYNANRSITNNKIIGNPTIGDRVEVRTYNCSYTITKL